MLKINGRCAIVLPYGEDLTGKSNSLVNLREFLMKTCDLKEVIYLPAGIFTHTTIKTCVFYFIKKKDGKDVLETNIKISKTTQKETNREYKFSKSHQTHKVNFYEYNPYEDKKTLLLEVSIDKIKTNSYSLNYSEYIEEKKNDIEINDDIIVKKLKDICEFKNGKAIKKDDLVEGNYPVIGGGQKPMGYHNNYNNEENTILCSSSGAYAGYISKYNSKIWASDCFSIKPISNLITNEYLFYFLKSSQDDIYKFQAGSAQPHVYSKDLENFKIPIPPLEKQKYIVNYLDYMYEKSNRTTEEQIEQLKKLNEYYINNGKAIKKNDLIEGRYPVIGGGQKPMGYHNEYNTEENTIVCSSSGAYAGYISKYDSKIWISDCFSIKPINNSITNEYLFYFLKSSQNDIYKFQTGSAQPHVYSKDLEKIKISIPPIEKQKEIIEYCNSNNKLIEQLEKLIEKNKNIAKNFISQIIKKNNSDLTSVISSENYNLNNSDLDNSDSESDNDSKKVVKKSISVKRSKKVIEKSNSESDLEEEFNKITSKNEKKKSKNT